MNRTALFAHAPICLIAGRGGLPVAVSQQLDKIGIPFKTIGLNGYDTTRLEVDLAIALHQWTPLKKALKNWAIASVVFAGKVDRPSGVLIPDLTLARYLPRLGLSSRGDDGVMREVMKIFEEDFAVKIVSPQEILGQEDLPVGNLGKYAPTVEQEADIKRGVEALRSLSAADFGQAIAVARGVILAIEAIEGTDAMMARAGQLRQSEQGGIVVKMPKVQQDTRIDAPAIGVDTIEAMHRAGFAGLAISAQNTLILDQKAVVAKADQYGLFIRVID